MSRLKPDSLTAVALVTLLTFSGAPAGIPRLANIILPPEPNTEQSAAAEFVVDTLLAIQTQPPHIVTENEKAIRLAPGITLHLGHTQRARQLGLDAESLDRDGFVAHSDGTTVCLVPATPQGSSHAAAWLLREHFGMHWIWPDEDGVVFVDTGADSIAAFHQTIEPSFKERRVGHRPRQSAWDKALGLSSRYRYNHAIHHSLDNDLLQTRPEWFPVIDGERSAMDGGRGPHPNYLAEGFSEHAAAWARQMFENAPTLHGISVAFSDSFLFDESPRNRRHTYPNRFFRGQRDLTPLFFGFANEVAAELWAWNDRPDNADPNVITQLAYFFSEKPPSFPIHPRVMPWLTSDRAQWFDPIQREADEELIRQWSLCGAAELGSWDYYEGHPYFIPRVYTKIVGDSLKLLHDNGFRSFFAEGARIDGFDVPRHWLASQLLWDIQQNPDTLMDQFYELCYGPAADAMRRFFDRCEAAWMAQPGPARWLKYFSSPAQAELFPPELCTELGSYLAEAESLAPNPVIRKRVRATREAFIITTKASQHYQNWKRLASLPEVPTNSLSDFRITRSELAAAIENMEPLGRPLGNLVRLDPTNRGTRLPTGTIPLLDESFDSPLIEGDAQGFNAANMMRSVGRLAPGSWKISAPATEFLSIRRFRRTETASGYLRIEGVHNGLVSTRVPVNPGEAIVATATIRGNLTGDTMVYFTPVFLNKTGQSIGQSTSDGLPIGSHRWIPLTTRFRVPNDAAMLEPRLYLFNQSPGDFLEIDSVQVHLLPGSTSASSTQD